MVQSLKRVGIGILTVALVVFMLPNFHDWVWSPFTPEAAQAAGSISSPTWVLSSSTEAATNVTYTHTFTTTTAVPVNGTIDIEFRQQQNSGPMLPNLSTVTVALGSTTQLVGAKPNIFFAGPSMVLSFFNTVSSIPAGKIKLILTGIGNPQTGGALLTNTSTSANGQPLDGTRFGPDTNGQLTIGTVKLSGKFTDATTGTAISGLPVEIHPGPNSSNQNGFWRATTDSSGTYAFAGLTNGQFVFEMSQLDPNGRQTAELSQYAKFEPTNITISDTPQTINKTLTKSQKKIIGKVVYDGTTTPVIGANVGANSMGPGSFANAQTGSDGSFTLRLGAGGNLFFSVQPGVNRPNGSNQGGPNPGVKTQENIPGQQPQNGQGQQPPQVQVADDFAAYQRPLAFTKGDTEPETLDLGTIAVRKADATIIGKLLNPDGSPATGGAGLMNFLDHSFNPVFLGSDGSFTAKGLAGSQYKLDSFDPTGGFSIPKVEFVAKKGTNDLGTIRKSANDKTVTITATRIDGGTERPIANVQAMVFPLDPGPPYFGTTNASGIAAVKVPAGFEGRATVNPGGSFGGGPQLDGSGAKNGLGPKEVTSSDTSDINTLFPLTGMQKVTAGDAITVKFDKADKTVSIRTVDASNNLVTAGAFVEAHPIGGTVNAHFGCPTAGGTGTCHTTSGKMQFQAIFPPDSNYVGKATTADITSATQTVNVSVVKKTVTVTGQVQDGSNHDAVIKDANLQIQVAAFGDGFMTMGKYDPSTGTYSMKIPADTKVHLGVAAGDPGRGISLGGYIPNVDSDDISAGDGQTVTKNVKLAKVDAVVKGKITDDTGNALEGIAVIADPGLAQIVGPEGDRGPEGRGPVGPGFGFNGVTDSTGNYSINVAPGKYNMIVKAVKEKGLFDTGIHQVSPKSGETITTDIQLKKADASLTIDVNNQSGDLNGSSVQIFNDKGTISLNIKDGSDGDKDGKVNGVVMVDVPADTYNVKAGEDFDSGKVEQSSVKKLNAQSGSTVETRLTTDAQDNALSKAVSTDVNSSSGTVVALSNNGATQATVTIPAGAISSSSSSDSSSSGSPVLSVTPMEAELPATKAATPIGAGIRVTATDSDGSSVSSLAAPVTAEISYDESKLPTGVDPKDLKINAYNEATGQWEAVQSNSVDTVNKKVVFTTTHFTDFAIVTSDDTTVDNTAPTEASDLRVIAKNSGKKIANKLTWKNPTDTDFDHVSIYRSTSKGSLGDKIKDTATSDTSYVDMGLVKKSTYYYTFRSVDTSSNAATNTDQISIASTKVRVRADAKSALNQAKAAAATTYNQAKAAAAATKAAAGTDKKAKAAANKVYAKSLVAAAKEKAKTLAAAQKTYAASIKGF